MKSAAPAVPSRSSQSYTAAAASVSTVAAPVAEKPASYSYSVSVLNTNDYSQSTESSVAAPVFWKDVSLWVLLLLIVLLLLVCPFSFSFSFSFLCFWLIGWFQTIAAVVIGVVILVYRYIL